MDNGKVVEQNKKSIILFPIMISRSYVLHSKDLSISIHLEYISMLHFLSWFCIFFNKNNINIYILLKAIYLFIFYL